MDINAAKTESENNHNTDAESQVLSQNTIISDYIKADEAEPHCADIRTIEPMTLDTAKDIPANMTINTNPHLQNVDDSEIHEILKKTKRNKGCSQEDFFKKKRHYFIMTDGGKPIYSRYGDEVENCMLFGTFSAMITKYTIFLSTAEQKQKLHCISNEKNKMIFFQKDSLVFIAYSSKADSVSLLYSQLQYLYNQLVSILSEPIVKVFDEHSSQCLRAMNGTEELFEQLIEYSTHTFTTLLNSYAVIPLKDRSRIQKICEENRGNAIMCLMLTPYEVIGVTYDGIINKAMAQSMDVILIQNLILSNPSLRLTESWVPLCLPGISSGGYLQLYCQFTEDKIGVCFITNSQDPEFFMTFSKQFNTINETIINENLVDKILTNSVDTNEDMPDKKLEELMKLKEEDFVEELLSKFECELSLKEEEEEAKEMQENRKRRTSVAKAMNKGGDAFAEIMYGLCQNMEKEQYFTIKLSHNYKKMKKEEKVIIQEYICLYDKYKECLDESKECFFVCKGAVSNNILYKYDHFLLFASFNYFIDAEEVASKSRELIKYIRANEKEYFIMFKVK